MRVLISIFVILLLVGNSHGSENISQDEIQKLYDFTDRFLISYRSYVSFNLPEKIQDYKNEKGDYQFFPFKHETIEIKIFYTHGDMVAFLFIPSSKNSLEIIEYEKPYLNLFGISWAVNGTYSLAKECNNLIETDIVAYKSPCVYFFSKSQMKNPSYAKEIANEYVNWENQTVHKTIETKNINEIWIPFKNENEEIVWEYNLNHISSEIDKKIMLDDSYTYERFLLDFNQINLSISHYKQLPLMIEKWNDFVNSDTVKKFCLDCYPKIDRNFGKVRNNFVSNESYMLANLDEDLLKLNNSINSIQSELQNKSIKSRFSNFFNQLNLFFKLIIFGILAVLSYFLVIRQIIKERNQIKDEITYSFYILRIELCKLTELILLKVKQRRKGE